MSYVRTLTRLLGLVIIPVFGLVSPLLVIPAITSTFGADAWVGVALGQSVGGAGSVLVELGWGLSGPQRVARQGRNFRLQIMAVSVLSKLLVFLPVGAVAFAVAYSLSPAYQVEAGLVAVGATSLGLSCSWFFIGTKRIGSLVVADAIPRTTCAALSAVVILIGGPLWTYPLLGMLLPSLVSLWLALLINRVSYSHMGAFSFRRIISLIVIQRTALSGRALSAVYIALPVTIVTLASPVSAPVFAAAERLQRMYLQLLGAFPNVMQSWLGSSRNRRAKKSRANSVILYNFFLGVVAGLAFSIGAPYAATYVFSGVAPIPFEISSVSGLLILLVCSSRATGGLALVAFQKLHIIAWSALAGVVVGVPAIFIFARWLGPLGGVVGEVTAESAVLAIQLTGLYRATKRRQAHRAVTPRKVSLTAAER